MKISVGQIPAVLETCRAMGAIPYLEGPPGGGKSESVKQFVDSLRVKLGNPKDFFDEEFRGSSSEPTDITGLPFPKDGRTIFLRPDFYPEDPNLQGVWFWDEFPQSSPAMMCALTPILDRTGPGKNFPKGIMIILAGNRVADGASVNRIPSHIRNRILHFEIAFSVDDWSTYNLSIGTRPEIVAFGRFKPEMFCDTPPKDGRPFMSGRSLTRCSKILELGVGKPLDLAMYAALIGDEAATVLTGFLRVRQSIVSPDVILLDPVGAPIPTEKSAMIAVCTALAHKSTVGNFDRICQYALRLAPEDSIALVVGSIQKDNAQRRLNPATAGQPLAACGGKAFIDWSVKFQDVLK